MIAVTNKARRRVFIADLSLTLVACFALAPFARAEDKPAAADLATRVHTDDVAVERAMRDELARSTSELRLGDEPKPYYVAYTISDIDQATVSATFGALTSDVDFQARVLRTDVRVGDPSFDNSNFEGSGGHIESLPIEDDYAALRRELWLRTDEGYKSAVETLARKRSTESGQAKGESDDAVGDFSSEPPTKLTMPRASRDVVEQTVSLRERVVKLSAILREYPAIQGSRVNASYAVGRRRMISSEGTWIDDSRRIVRIDVTADTQAEDGMKLRSFIPFTALAPAGLPAAADLEKSGARDGCRADRDAQGAGRAQRLGGRALRRPRRRADREAPARRAADRHAAAQDRVGGQRRARAVERARQQARSQGGVGLAIGRRRSAAGHRTGARAADRRLSRRRRGHSAEARVGDREGDPEGVC